MVPAGPAGSQVVRHLRSRPGKSLPEAARAGSATRLLGTHPERLQRGETAPTESGRDETEEVVLRKATNDLVGAGTYSRLIRGVVLGSQRLSAPLLTKGVS